MFRKNEEREDCANLKEDIVYLRQWRDKWLVKCKRMRMGKTTKLSRRNLEPSLRE